MQRPILHTLTSSNRLYNLSNLKTAALSPHTTAVMLAIDVFFHPFTSL